MEKTIAIVASPSMLEIAEGVHNALISSEKLKAAGFNYDFVPVTLKTFSNGEFVTQITKSVREKRVVYFGPSFAKPVPAFMETMMTANALHLASSSEIHLFLPFLGWMRQDRKDQPRVPITARLVADMLGTNNYIKRLTTIDLHVEQEEAFFNMPVNNLPGRIIHANVLRQRFGAECKNIRVVAPDINGAKQAKTLADLIGSDHPIGIFQKTRKGSADPELRYTGEDISGQDIVLSDDMCDTGGTLIEAGVWLQRMRARSITACFSHAIFSEKEGVTAEEKFARNGIKVISTDSIPRSKKYLRDNASWLTMASVVPYLSRVVYETHLAGSVSSLFKNPSMEALP